MLCPSYRSPTYLEEEVEDIFFLERDTDQVLSLDALLLALPVEGAVVKAEGRRGGAVGGAGGGAGGGARELVEQPLVLALDASHLVAGEGEVLAPPARAAPAAADGGAAGTGDQQHPVHPPA